MGEVSRKVERFSDTEFVAEFHNALGVLYPTLQRLDCLEDDTQPYDDFDSVAECLWEVLVQRSLMWKYGLDAIPQLPRYGFNTQDIGPDGYIQVRTASPPKEFRFVQFIGNRRFGPEPFNAVEGIDGSGNKILIKFDERVSFVWKRPNR